MPARILVIGLAALAIAACAPMPQPAPSAPPPGAQAAAAPAELAPTEPEMKPLPPSDLRVMKCSMLNSASDDDKAYAATFLLGYRAGLMHSHTLDTKKIDAVETAAMADCAAKPEAIASHVFAAAELKIAASTAPPRPHRLRHRLAPAAPAASPGPAEEPPMRYAPAEHAPTAETPAEPSPPAPAEMSPATPPSSEAPRE